LKQVFGDAAILVRMCSIHPQGWVPIETHWVLGLLEPRGM